VNRSRWEDPEQEVLHRPLHTIPLPLALRQGSRIAATQHERAARELLSLLGLGILVLSLLVLAIGT